MVVSNRLNVTRNWGNERPRTGLALRHRRDGCSLQRTSYSGIASHTCVAARIRYCSLLDAGPDGRQGINESQVCAFVIRRGGRSFIFLKFSESCREIQQTHSRGTAAPHKSDCSRRKAYASHAGPSTWTSLAGRQGPGRNNAPDAAPGLIPQRNRH